MTRARTVAEVIAGEAVSGTPEQRIADMRAIASVIANRAALLGVTPEQVVANSNEFNAYNRSLPPGVGQQIIDMAQEQVDYVAENGPVNNATFYATPAAVDNLPNGLSYEDSTTGHQYFSDPQSRAIGTSEGYVQPNRYAYAQNLDVAGLPTPYAADDLTNNSLLSAFSTTPTYSEDPFSAVLGGSQPAVNQWDAMAAAKPIQSPMGSVQAAGLLGVNPELAAQATVNPMMSLEASGLLGTNPGLSANATVSGLPEVASVSSRMGIAEPGFDQSRFDGMPVSVATDFDPGRFAAPATQAFDQSRFAGLLDPTTNTQSFMDQPAEPANLGSFPDAYAAQRGPSTGLLSAEMGQRMADVQRQLLNPAMQAPAVTPSYDVTASGVLGGVPGLEAQATVPSVPDPTTTSSVTPGLLSPTSIVSASPALTTTVPTGILGAQPVQQNAFVDSFPDAVANNTIEPATVNDVVAAPTLDNIQVSDQPAVATVDGPATTPALEQQDQVEQQTAKTTPAATTTTTTQPTEKATLGQRITKAINPGTVTGGLLGGLAAGPVGGLLGGLLGNSVYNGGLLSSQPMSINNIGGGLLNTSSIWGGGQPPGTQATASDGQQITAMPGGNVAITNSYGTTTVFDRNGKAMSYFGSGLGTDNSAPAPGGYGASGGYAPS